MEQIAKETDPIIPTLVVGPVFDRGDSTYWFVVEISNEKLRVGVLIKRILLFVNFTKLMTRQRRDPKFTMLV